MKALLPLFQSLPDQNWMSIHADRGKHSGLSGLKLVRTVAVSTRSPVTYIFGLIKVASLLFLRRQSLGWAFLIPNSLADLLLCYIAVWFKLDTVCFVMDDFPRAKQQIWRRRLESGLLGGIFKMSTISYCVSAMMRDEFKNRYGREADAIYCKTWPSDLMAAPSEKKLIKRFVWIGTFNSFYLKPLLELRAVLIGTEVVVDLYSIQEPPKDLLTSNIRYRGSLKDEAVIATLATYDAALITYSDDVDTLNFMRLSYPSKIVDYNSAALPILILAPKALCFLNQKDLSSFSIHSASVNRQDISRALSSFCSLAPSELSRMSRASGSQARESFTREAALRTINQLMSDRRTGTENETRT